jgi:hypothetical protein
MKKVYLFATTALLFLVLSAFEQTNTITGKITAVHPFNDEYAVTVGNTTMVLMIGKRDSTGYLFAINREYQDILIKNKGEYVLNPKYTNKLFTVSYTVNGKGWKCIKKIE